MRAYVLCHWLRASNPWNVPMEAHSHRAEGALISKHLILSGGMLSRSEKRGRREFLREVRSSPVGEDSLGRTSKICVLGLEDRPLAV